MSYIPVVLNANPTAYYVLNDSAGSAAVELMHGWNGVYQNALLAQPGFGGTVGVQFPDTTPHGLVRLNHGGWYGAFAPTAGTILLWIKPLPGIWNDPASRWILNLACTSGYIRLDNANGGLRVRHSGSGISLNVGYPMDADNRWIGILLRWSVALGICQVTIDGVQQANMGAPGAQPTPLVADTVLAAQSIAGTHPMPSTLNHFAYWDTMISDDLVSQLTEVSGMVDKCTFSCTHTDYDGERSNHGFNVTPLTAANFDAQNTLMNLYLAALVEMVLGNRYKSGQGNWVLNNIENASDQAAQRELKWLIQYHDGTTLKSYSVELPTAKTAVLDPNDRAHAHIGDAGVVDAFVSAFEAYALTPDGHAPIVDEITLVGRPI